MRKFPVCLVLGLVLALSRIPFAAAQECSFHMPPGWGQARAAWFGPCADGRANGLGVLRAYVGGKPGEAFFGRMALGDMVFGVMETADGYAAGEFANGRALESDDRQKLIAAFRTGAQGARAASDLFERENNPGSAQFYAGKADQLLRQMD